MRIFNLDDEIAVDYIPFVYKQSRKIFLTSLVHIEKQTLPKIFPKIYTSETLKRQFILFLKSKSIEIAENNFHIWKPFEAEKVTLSNGNCYEILPCCPKDSSTSILLVFRQDSKISHIYVGLCSDLRSTLLSFKLVSWLRKDAKLSLYVPNNKACKRCVDCEFYKAMKKIEKKLNSDNLGKLLIQVPLFGSEAFISGLASEFRGHVAICGLLKEIYMSLPTVKIEHFTENFRSSRILLTAYDTNEFLSTNLKRDGGAISKQYTLKWSPLPSKNELNLLSDLVRPAKIYGTKFEDSHESLEHPVQMSSVFYGSSQTNNELASQAIKRQTIEDQCCLENSQRLDQQVIKNVKAFLSKTTRKNEPRKEDNETVVDLTRVTPTEQCPNSAADMIESTAEAQQNPQEETPQQQLEKQPANSTENQLVKPFTIRLKRHKQILEKQPTIAAHGTNNIEIVQTQAKSTNPRKRETQSTKSSNGKIEKQQTLKRQEAKNVKTKKLTCPNKSSLVYRKGKKGIGFVDEDTSSSG